jgi:hypothetical protein
LVPFGGLSQQQFAIFTPCGWGASGQTGQAHNRLSSTPYLRHCHFSCSRSDPACMIFCSVRFIFCNGILINLSWSKVMKPQSNGFFGPSCLLRTRANTHIPREGSSPRPSAATRDTSPRAARGLDMTSRRDHAQRPRGTRATSLRRPVRAYTHTHLTTRSAGAWFPISSGAAQIQHA